MIPFVCIYRKASIAEIVAEVIDSKKTTSILRDNDHGAAAGCAILEHTLLWRGEIRTLKPESNRPILITTEIRVATSD